MNPKTTIDPRPPSDEYEKFFDLVFDLADSDRSRLNDLFDDPKYISHPDYIVGLLRLTFPIRDELSNWYPFLTKARLLVEPLELIGLDDKSRS